MATTIVNTPANSGENSSGSGFLLGMIILAVLVFLGIVYGLPYIRQAASRTTETNVKVEVPKQVDVNVTTPEEK